MSGSKISGLIFLDENADGIEESGDNGVGGLTVSLYSSAGVFVSSVTSATDGSYAFTGLLAGSYYVKVTPATGQNFSQVGTSATLPDSSTNSSGQTPTVSLNGTNSVVQNAGVYVPVSISGTVFSDANDNGMVDGSDKGISGATVQLLNGSGQPTGATATTDANGNYTFSNLAPGSYAVHVVMPASEPTGTVYSPYGSNTAPQPTDGTVNQQQNLLVNGSFDNGEPINGLGTTTAGFSGWTVSVNSSSTPYGSGPGNGPEIDFTNSVTNTAIDPLSHTNQYAGVVAPDNANPNYAGGSGTHAAFFVDDGAIETLSQTVNLVAGQTYEVGFDLDETLPGTANPGFFQLSASIGGMTIVTASSTSGTHLTPGTWTHFADLYTPTVSGPVTLTFAYQSGVLGSTQTAKDVLVDDVYIVKGQVTPNLTPTSEVNTGGTTATFTLTSGQTIGDESAGVYTPPATIQGNVFTDLNADGAGESGDAGFAGITVGLYSGSTLVATTKTDASGNYVFNNEAAGTYTVKISPPTGSAFSPTGSSTTLTDSTVNSSGAATVTVINGGVGVVNAGLYTPITVKGTVFSDANADGAQQSGDAGVNTVTVQLLSSSGTVLATTTTNSSGAYSFANQLPGAYEIKVVAPSGQTFSPQGTSATLTDSNVASNGVTAAFTATSGQTATENAGLYTPATISGTVFTDANADGAQQTGDAGLAGVTVQLLNSSGAVVGSTVTNSSGQYSAAVAPGNYTVQVVLPNGDKFSPTGASTTLTDSNVSTTGAAAVALSSGGSATVNAGIYAPASVTGTIFTDLNDDGVKEAGDPSVSGQTVKLLGSDGRTVVATTTTDANGNYSFAGLTPGAYTVQTAAPAGQSFSPAGASTSLPDSTIGANGTQAITLTSGSSAVVNAGEFGQGTVTGVVFNDLNADGVRESGDAGLAGQTVTLVGANGQVIATTTTNASGAYAFNGVTPGSDTVQFTPASGNTLTTAASAPVSVTSGNTATANAGEYLPSTISGTVFNDLNADGAQQSGDAGLSGQTVNLLNSSGTTIATTTTGTNGAYSFTGVTPGSDTVQFVVKSGDTFSTASSDAVTVTSGSSNVFNAGEYAPSTINGTVFNDLNADGTQQSGDAGLSGQTVNLLNAAGTTIATTTTGTNGTYSFTGVTPGADTVQFVVKSGDTFSTPSTAAVTVTSGSSATVNAGEYAPGAINGTVFNDVNGDGTQETGDAGLSGQTVNLLNAAGATIATTTTGTNGAYSFTGVKPGADTVQFVVNSGDAFSTPSSVPVTVTSGSSATVNAGEYAPGTINGTVFNDLNADGTQQNTDAGLSGQTVNLLNAAGTTIATTTTANNGAYSFTGVAPGADTVQFVVKSGDIFSTPSSAAVTVTSGSSATVNAGEYAPSTISGVVFNDVNGDGTQQGGDAGLAGQTVNLLNAAGTTIATTTTGTNGAYSFTAVAPGSDTVQFVVKAGDAFSTPSSDAVTVTSGSSSTVNAGEYAPGTISGTVFNDLNADGTQQSGDLGLTGQTVNLLNAAGTTIATTTTGTNGAYSFTGVKPGADTVQFVVKSGDTFSTPSSDAVTVTSGSSATANAGEYAPGAISGTVFNDLNADGTQQGGDAGLSGQTVNLLNAAGATIATTTTGTNGAYSFTGVTPGSDTVQFVVKSGDAFSTPSSDAVTVTSGSSSTVNAGEYAPSTISGTVFNDLNGDGTQQSGDAGLSGQTVNLLNAAGTTIATTTTGTNGAYSFTGVTPGSDTVQFVVKSGDSFSTASSDAVTVTSGSSSTANAGEYAPSTISGTVFNDLNADGTQQGGDLGLSGQTVNLLNSAGTTIATTTTGTNGAYSFTGVKPGADTVQFVVKAGDTFSTPSSDPVMVTSGSSSTVNAGEYAPSTISGTVFNDVNDNGTQDSGDLGLSGQTVNLLNAAGTTIATTTTGTNGAYSFTGVTPGADMVQFVAKSGDSFSTPGSVAVNVTSGSSTTVNAGEYAGSTINGTVFNDLNADGTQENGDLGLSGQTVNLLNSSGATIATTTTGTNGTYSFANVSPGSDSVQFVVKSGDTFSTPSSVPVTVTSGSGATVNAGEYAPGTISGTVFNDLNADGTQQGGDVGLSGQTVNLLNAAGSTIATTTTGTGGAYSFTAVKPGADTVQFVVKSGDTFSTPGSDAVTVTSGSSSTVNAGEYAPSTISGTVFNDLNADGTQQGGDLGLSGQTVNLLNSSGTTIATTTTATNGTYSFTGVAPGADTVQFVVKSGDIFSTPSSDAVTVTSGSSSTANAGEYAPGTISGTVFNDLNADGTQQSGDAGLSGQTVNLLNAAGTTIATTTTGTNGAYSFTGVTPGSDTVQFVVKSGDAFSTASSDAVTVTSGSSSTANAGEYAPSTISGTVFNDLNADGTQQGGDAGLSGQTVNLLNASGTTIATTTTGTNGAYSFSNVAPGSDTVQFIVKSGDTFSTPSSDAVTVTSGSSSTANAGEYAPSTISGTVFNDLNADGTQQSGDAGLSGQTVNLLNAAGTTIATTTTGTNGAYSFTGVAPGSDTVQFVVKAGDTFSTPSSDAVTATSGSSSTVNAGEYAPSTISGTVFNDVNADGTQQSGDAGLSGQTVNLLNSAGTTIATTTTGTNGAYSFTGVAPGADTVQFVAAAGETFSTPSSDSVTVTSGSSATANAGEYAGSSISGTVFNDLNADGTQQSTDGGLSGQTVNLLNASGATIATTTTGTNGGYSFGNVAPGSDTVQFVVKPGDIFSTPSSAAVTVTSGGTSTVNAGEYAPSTISGTVFDDLNADGTQESGDLGLSGQTVNLLNAGGTTIATTTTGTNGAYSFTGVTPGSDTVQIVAAPGDIFTTPSSTPVTVTSGSSATVNAGEYAPSVITGTVFNDLNGDGAQQAGEPGLSGQTVNLLDSNGQLIATTTTGTNGGYSFGNVVPGSDTVQVVGAPGDTFSGGGNGSTPVTVTSGSTTNVNTGEFAPATISGTVFNDLNADGAQEAGESGLGGQAVQLVGPGGVVIATTGTNPDGTYSFSGVAPGSDTVQFVAAAGDVFTTPSSVPVTITSGGSATANAGEFAGSIITGTVFNDLNGDGAQETGEPGLSGQTVNLLGSNGQTIATTTTDQNGGYSFGGVVPGSDTVQVVGVPGDTFTTGGGGLTPVTVTSGSATNVNTGEYAPSTITGTVFNDLNGDSTQELGEPGLAGQTVNLLDGNGQTIATTTTNGNGVYSFTGVVPGADTVQFVPAPGEAFSTPSSDPVTVTSGSTTTVNAGEVAPSVITGILFLDANGNGAQDPGDAGISGQTVNLLDASGNLLATTTTGANGAYSFTGVNPGNDVVAIAAPAGDSFSPAGTSATLTDSNVSVAGVGGVTVTSGSSSTINAGVYAPSSFTVQVYNDANIDGTLDNGELGISGVPVQLLNGSGSAVVAIGTTTSNGTVTFTGLAPGSYEAKVSNPLAYTVTQAVNIGSPVTLTSGSAAQAIEGLLAPPPGQIDGHVFVNTACTGLYQVGDANVAGVTVELLSGSGTPFTQNGTIITTTTDANGNYRFTSIAAGYYQEKFILPTGLSFTTQRAGTDDTINSAPDQTTGVTGVFLLAGGEDDTTENAGVYLNGKSAANTAVVQAGTAVSFNTGGTLVLGAGNDNIHTTTGNNAIIIGSQGSDGGNIVETGSGTDIVYSCSSLNAQALGSGTNPASNLGFSDYLFGGTGTNDLQGGAGSDYLMGGPGVNLIAGGSGTSEVIAGSNSAGYGVVTRGAGGAISNWTVNNEIRPGNGASTIVYQKGDGVMLLDTFKPGLDAMTIYGYPAGTTGTFTTANGHTVLDLGGNDIIVFNDTYTATSGGITFSTSTAPLLVLHFDANGMPYFSAPVVNAAAVGETVSFDANTVTKQATVTGAGGQSITLGFSSAALATQAAAQLAIVNAAIANGSMVAEEVVSGVLPVLPAAIAGLAEIDTTGAVYLGAGYTTSVDTASGPTTVLAVAAGDHLIMASNSTGALLYAGDTGADTVYAGAGDGLIFGGGASLNFLGGSGAATIIGGTAGNTVTGGGGSQLIFGSTTLNYTGGTGAATIIGGGSGNTVTGGAGNELIFASSSMTYNGGAGAATLIGGGGPLNANLGAGGGLAYGGPGGGNTLTSGSGTSILVGAGNGDLLTATGSGNDTLVAGAGNETLDGSASTGNLVLFGGPGSDSITGGSGGNLFIAESGNETLTAAGTSNSIIFIATPGTTRTDVINGFNPNHDAIGLFGYGSGADAAALASLTTSGGNTNLTLSDGTKIVFTGAPTLHSYNFF